MHYAIGDVHGCYNTLLRLLDQINYEPLTDTLWFVGDLVNRGPDSLAVMEFVRQCPPTTVVILGNHDLHFLAVAHAVVAEQAKDTLSGLLKVDNLKEIVNFLRQQKLFHYDENLEFAMVHAGVPPQWSLSQTQQHANEIEALLQSDKLLDFLQHMYGDQPDIWDEQLSGWDRYRIIVNYLTRMRFCDKNGKLDLTAKAKLGSQPAGLLPWFDVSRRCLAETKIIFGHWAALQGELKRENCFAIDGGCVWGGTLIALCLETQQRVSVDSVG